MRQHTTLLLFAVLLATIGCKDEKTTVNAQVLEEDAISPLLEQPIQIDTKQADRDLAFWKSKYVDGKPTPIALIGEGGARIARFRESNDVTELNAGVRDLEHADSLNPSVSAAYKRTLASAYISQHRFEEAYQALQQAVENGEKRQLSYLQLFDAAMETGRYEEGLALLDSIENKNDFNYLIRAAKYNDYAGDLDQTIVFMEQARDIMIQKKDTAMMKWSYTNLGDYYGHAGRIDDSYDSFMQSINLNPNDRYARKGIAYILHAAKDNQEAARKILKVADPDESRPAYLSLLADVEDISGNTTEAERLRAKHDEIIARRDWGNMYRLEVAKQRIDNEHTLDQGIALLEEELELRKDPIIYAVMAYAMAQQANSDMEKQAVVDYIAQHVDNKTFEPDANVYRYKAYKKLGMADRAAAYEAGLREAAYELGPITMRELGVN